MKCSQGFIYEKSSEYLHKNPAVLCGSVLPYL